LRAVHDVSSGGLAVALAEMAAASGLGASLDLGEPVELFSELPSRFVVATSEAEELCALASGRGVPAAVLGRVGGGLFSLGTLVDLPLEAVVEAHEGNLARLLGDQ
jgi:phosphoribosylformylglycinamidine synthase